MTRLWSALVVAAGCAGGEPTDEDRIEAILELEGRAERGGELYAASCSSCHGEDGSATAGGTVLSGTDLRGLDRERIVTAVVVPPGGMLTFDTVPEQDVADIAAFVGAL